MRSLVMALSTVAAVICAIGPATAQYYYEDDEAPRYRRPQMQCYGGRLLSARIHDPGRRVPTVSRPDWT